MRALLRTTALLFVLVCAAFAPALAQDEVSLDTRFEHLATHHTGDSRVDLVALTALARGADDALRADLEARYIALLDGGCTDAAMEFALREIALVGGERSLPTLRRLVGAEARPLDSLVFEAMVSLGAVDAPHTQDPVGARQRELYAAFAPFDARARAEARLGAALAQLEGSSSPAKPYDARSLETAVKLFVSTRAAGLTGDPFGHHVLELARDSSVAAKPEERIAACDRVLADGGDPMVRGRALRVIAGLSPADLGARVATEVARRPAAEAAASIRVLAGRGLSAEADGPLLEVLLASVERNDVLGTTCRDVLVGRPQGELDERLAASVRDARRSDALRAALLEILVERGGATWMELVREHVSNDGTALGNAAWRTVGRFASDSDVDFVLAGVLATRSTEVLATQGAALESLAARTRDSKGLAARTARAFNSASSEQRRALLPAFARLGGAESVACVRSALGEQQLASAAIEVLGQWRDAAAFEPLAALLGGERRSEAYRACTLLAQGIAARQPTEAGALLRALDADVRDSSERLALIAAAGYVPDASAAAVLTPALADPMYVESASASVLRITPQLGARDRTTAQALLVALLAANPDDATARTARARIDALEADDDFLLAWRVAGPFTKEGVGGDQILSEVFAPERAPDDPSILWRDVFATGHANRGLFDLGAVLGHVSNCTGYARTNVWSEIAQDVRLELGSDDSLCVWLNGTEVHRNNAQRGVTRGEDVVPVALRAGWNTLMLEVGQGGGDWGFCCRLRGADGLAARGWRCDRIQRAIEPPPGAVLLTDDDTTAWRHLDGRPLEWRLERGVLAGTPGTGDIVSSAVFGDCSVHVEFQVPDEPGLPNGQGRGNSGVYVQSRYEVQVLNSFGEPPRIDECGAIYGVAAPRVQMAARPGEWQVYDIEFTAARWKNGAKVSDARMTVVHNGVLVHDDVHVSDSTGAGQAEREGKGPLLLQDHGHALRFRNVWVLEHEAGVGAGARATSLHTSSTAWMQRGGKAAYERLADEIVGRTAPNEPNSFLCTQAEFADFALALEFRIDAELNSGVQIRSHAVPQVAEGRVFGYQVEIDPTERAFSAGIYEESRRGWLADLEGRDLERGAYRNGEWNTLDVVARGDVLRTWLNGVPCVVLVDGATASGFIALQVHGVGARSDPLEVRWRNVRLARL